MGMHAHMRTCTRTHTHTHADACCWNLHSYAGKRDLLLHVYRGAQTHMQTDTHMRLHMLNWF